MRIILATKSEYKIEAFKNLKIDFKAIAADVDEKDYRSDDPKKLVLELAKRKAEVVSAKNPDAIIIGLDSVGFFKDKILEKPKTKEEAVQRLKELSGKSHICFTGVCMIIPEKESFLEVSKTFVKLRELSDKEIKRYVENDPAVLDICLGYDPGINISASFVESCEGSLHNLLTGVPFEIIVPVLEKYLD